MMPKIGAQGECAALDVRWLHPLVSKEAVERTFKIYGAIKYVQIRSGMGWAGVPKTTVPFVY